METTDKNKIIALFMGCKFMGNATVTVPGLHTMSEDDLRYHSDWNWLHQVISEIEDFFYTINGEEIEFRVVQYEDEVLIVAKYQLKRWENIVEVLSSGDGKLKNTYEAVYQFIVWYNQQQKL